MSSRPAWTAAVRIAGAAWVLACAGGLRAADEPLWRFGWVADTRAQECNWIASLLTEVRGNRPSMLLHSGDTRFEWANRCAWQETMVLLRWASPPIEFHLAPGPQDLEHGVLRKHLRRAATQGLYRLDTGRIAPRAGYERNRVTRFVSGPEWPVWNPEVVRHPAWQVGTDDRVAEGVLPYRYVFSRGGIRFVVCEPYATEDQRDWIRRIVTQRDGSSATIVLHHAHGVDALARYFDGLEGRHNVRLVLSGDHPHYRYEERDGIAYINAAGMFLGPHGECDAFTMHVYRDRLELDRHVLPPGLPIRPISAPVTVWTCPGEFAPYERPEPSDKAAATASRAVPGATPTAAAPRAVVGENLLVNGDFENGAWYVRFRGWSPTGWYQWFTPPHAPEHVAETSRPHSGTHHVRLHMWAHPWQAGILQTVRGVEPCRWYRLTGYGDAQPPDSLPSRTRIGIDVRGVLAAQFSADVSRHPADAYDEAIGGGVRYDGWTAGVGLPEGIVWSAVQHPHGWAEFAVEAEALSDTITVILASSWQVRPEYGPIYETNWDTFALREIPWPTPRLVPYGTPCEPHEAVRNMTVRVHPGLRSASVAWGTDMPAGACQVLYRFLDPGEADLRLDGGAAASPGTYDEFPMDTPVVYARSAVFHAAAIEPLDPPPDAVKMEVVALSRALVDGRAITLASAPVVVPLP